MCTTRTSRPAAVSSSRRETSKTSNVRLGVIPRRASGPRGPPARDVPPAREVAPARGWPSTGRGACGGGRRRGARARACATDRPGIVRRAHHCGRAGDERRRRPCSIYFRHEEKSVPASRAQHASVDVSPPRWRPRHSARAPRGRPPRVVRLPLRPSRDARRGGPPRASRRPARGARRVGRARRQTAPRRTSYPPSRRASPRRARRGPPSPTPRLPSPLAPSRATRARLDPPPPAPPPPGAAICSWR